MNGFQASIALVDGKKTAVIFFDFAYRTKPSFLTPSSPPRDHAF